MERVSSNGKSTLTADAEIDKTLQPYALIAGILHVICYAGMVSALMLIIWLSFDVGFKTLMSCIVLDYCIKKAHQWIDSMYIATGTATYTLARKAVQVTH